MSQSMQSQHTEDLNNYTNKIIKSILTLSTQNNWILNYDAKYYSSLQQNSIHD